MVSLVVVRGVNGKNDRMEQGRCEVVEVKEDTHASRRPNTLPTSSSDHGDSVVFEVKDCGSLGREGVVLESAAGKTGGGDGNAQEARSCWYIKRLSLREPEKQVLQSLTVLAIRERAADMLLWSSGGFGGGPWLRL